MCDKTVDVAKTVHDLFLHGKRTLIIPLIICAILWSYWHLVLVGTVSANVKAVMNVPSAISLCLKSGSTTMIDSPYCYWERHLAVEKICTGFPEAPAGSQITKIQPESSC